VSTGRSVNTVSGCSGLRIRNKAGLPDLAWRMATGMIGTGHGTDQPLGTQSGNFVSIHVGLGATHPREPLLLRPREKKCKKNNRGPKVLEVSSRSPWSRAGQLGRLRTLGDCAHFCAHHPLGLEFERNLSGSCVVLLVVTLPSAPMPGKDHSVSLGCQVAGEAWQTQHERSARFDEIRC
jgi:hypothetical protein